MSHRIASWGFVGVSLICRLVPSANGTTTILTVDDFGGGPHGVSLTSTLPPELATGTFAYPGAVGGVRDVFVLSTTSGIFQGGVAFGSAGYASFVGSGRAGVIWDGSSAAPVDVNGDGTMDPSDAEFGLNLDLVTDCTSPFIHLRASADLPNATVSLLFANSATDYGIYDIPLTTVGAVDDYFAPVFSPSSTSGAYDPTQVRAISLLIDGTAFDNLDVQASLLAIECRDSSTTVPEPGTWMAMGGLSGVLGLAWIRSRKASRTR